LTNVVNGTGGTFGKSAPQSPRSDIGSQLRYQTLNLKKFAQSIPNSNIANTTSNLEDSVDYSKTILEKDALIAEL
jgi:hypothetical protein